MLRFLNATMIDGKIERFNHCTIKLRTMATYFFTISQNLYLPRIYSRKKVPIQYRLSMQMYKNTIVSFLCPRVNVFDKIYPTAVLILPSTFNRAPPKSHRGWCPRFARSPSLCFYLMHKSRKFLAPFRPSECACWPCPADKSPKNGDFRERGKYVANGAIGNSNSVAGDENIL